MNDECAALKRAVNEPCIVCGGASSRALHTLRYPDEGYPGLFAMRECSGCGLLFNSPRLRDEQIEALYDGGYYVFREPEHEALHRVARLAAQTVGVAQQFSDARELLEVGCAKGYLLALLRARGWTVRGVELSAEAAEFARTRFELPVHAGSLRSWLDAPAFRPAPMVLSTDVIEHVIDPLDFLLALHRATAPGGWLVIGTPNADSDHRRVLGAQWIGFNPFHIYLFTRATLAPLLQRAGFELVQAYTYTNGEPPPPLPAGGVRPALREALRASGVLPAARRARDALTALVQPRVSTHALQQRVAEIEFDDYLRSEDARSERRTACRGDNLVLVARRRP